MLIPGQARKSLWIETYFSSVVCAIGMVRLVRACGSKLISSRFMIPRSAGQARKSLWIETLEAGWEPSLEWGQARKSLWIETRSSSL